MKTVGMDQHDQCKVETLKAGRVLLLSIDRAPDNLVTPQMLASLGRAFDRFTRDSECEVAILSGTGRVFSKGFDVEVIRAHASRADQRTLLLLANDVCSRLAESSKPIVAAINGHCLGAGLELALTCHMRICTDKAWLGLPELGKGLLPGMGGIHRLVHLVGRSRALELIAAGGFLTADEAKLWGLVNRVVPQANFMESVLGFVDGILSVEPSLVRDVTRLTARAESQGDQTSVLETVDQIVRQLSP